MVYKVPYVKGEGVDPLFKKLIRGFKTSIKEKNDDVMVFSSGITNSGKSTLGLWAYHTFLEDEPGYEMDIDVIAFNSQQFADAMKTALKYPPGARFVNGDEFNITKHSVMTKFNKDLIDLYYAIRGENYFCWNNNPSADILQKEIIKDLVKGLVFCYTKYTDGRPRRYLYFTKDDLLKFLEKYKSLNNALLKKYGSRHASWEGWYHAYDEPFWKLYVEKKGSRMKSKIEEFADKYGSLSNKDYYITSQLSKKVNVAAETIRRYFLEMKDKELIEGVHYDIKGGKTIFYDEAIPVLHERKEKGQRAKMKNLLGVNR